MALSSNKRVIVARFDREALAGFVQTSEDFGTGPIELLQPEGNVLQIAPGEVKAVCFVRDFEGGDTWRKHRAFQTRPKTEGLWLRVRFQDGDTLEGLIPNNLLNLEPGGFTVIPPDPTFHNQRIFVPKASVTSVEVLGVIGTPLRKRPKAIPKVDEGKQIELFE